MNFRSRRNEARATLSSTGLHGDALGLASRAWSLVVSRARSHSWTRVWLPRWAWPCWPCPPAACGNMSTR